MHEGGRAMDIDLSSMAFRSAGSGRSPRRHGFLPIIDQPESSAARPGISIAAAATPRSTNTFRSGKAARSLPPYTQMAASAITSIGIQLDAAHDQDVAFLQSSLIRLGLNPARIDGVMGERTRGALKDAGAAGDDPAGCCALY